MHCALFLGIFVFLAELNGVVVARNRLVLGDSLIDISPIKLLQISHEEKHGKSNINEDKSQSVNAVSSQTVGIIVPLNPETATPSKPTASVHQGTTKSTTSEKNTQVRSSSAVSSVRESPKKESSSYHSGMQESFFNPGALPINQFEQGPPSAFSSYYHQPPTPRQSSVEAGPTSSKGASVPPPAAANEPVTVTEAPKTVTLTQVGISISTVTEVSTVKSVDSVSVIIATSSSTKTVTSLVAPSATSAPPAPAPPPPPAQAPPASPAPSPPLSPSPSPAPAPAPSSDEPMFSIAGIGNSIVTPLGSVTSAVMSPAAGLPASSFVTSAIPASTPAAAITDDEPDACQCACECPAGFLLQTKAASTELSTVPAPTSIPSSSTEITTSVPAPAPTSVPANSESSVSQAAPTTSSVEASSSESTSSTSITPAPDPASAQPTNVNINTIDLYSALTIAIG